MYQKQVSCVIITGFLNESKVFLEHKWGFCWVVTGLLVVTCVLDNSQNKIKIRQVFPRYKIHFFKKNTGTDENKQNEVAFENNECKSILATIQLIDKIELTSLLF